MTVPPQIQAYFAEYLADAVNLPNGFKDWITEWIEVNPPQILWADVVKPGSVVGGEAPIGSQVAYAGASDPNQSWLRCNGRTLQRAAYPDLGNVLSPGGPASFTIPNVAGQIIRAL